MTSFSQPTSTPLVLVVEDEPNIAGVLSAYLERDGLRIRMAHDGEEALQSFRQLRPDLVLLDIHLPKVDGVDVLKMIRSDGDVPVIMSPHWLTMWTSCWHCAWERTTMWSSPSTPPKS